MGFYELAEKALALERSGKKLIRLNVGETNLPTPKCAIDAAVKSIRKSKSGYGSSAGIVELREMIAEREGCGIGNVVVGPGSKHLLYGLMSVLCKKGSAVSFPSPYWPAYAMICRQLGLRTKIAPSYMEKDWVFEESEMEGAGLSIICNPLNPTSTAYSREIVGGTIERCQSRGGMVLLDEAYLGLSFVKIPRYDGAIRLRSFSKEFNMEGWRLGYAVAPKEIAEKLVAFNQITATCVARFVQEAGIACLENEGKLLKDNKKVWKRRADIACKSLRRAGFRFATPMAGIYVFATHEGITDSDSFALRLLEREGVVVAPGADFGGYQRFVRICVNQHEDVLEEGIAKMGALAERI